MLFKINKRLKQITTIEDLEKYLYSSKILFKYRKKEVIKYFELKDYNIPEFIIFF